MTKTTVFAIFFILQISFIAAFSGLAQAGTDNSVAEDIPFLVASLISQNPDPAAPGDLLELKFRLENRGTKAAEDLTVEILPKYPLLVSDSEKTKTAGSIFGRQKGADAVIVKFYLTVDTGAGSGISPIAIRYKAASSQTWTVINDAFNVTISQRDLPLSVTSVKPEPEMLIPGQKAAITVTISNFGTSDALNVRARLNLTDAMPIAAYGTTNEAFIPLIKAQGKADAGFSVIVSPDSKSSLYRIPVFISYSDKSGRNYSLNPQSFGIMVAPGPKFLASLVGSNDILKFNKRQKATIEIVNAGHGDVKLLTVRLAKSGAYDIISQETNYIGDLNIGDSETITYDVIPRQPGPFVLGLEYNDALNNAHKETIEAQAKIYTGSEASRLGLEKSNGKGILVTIAIVATGILAYRKLRKRK